MTKQYRHTVLGGTFDHLHDGHKSIIERAFKIAEKVTLGLTSDSFSHKKDSQKSIQTYEERLTELKNYLLQRDFNDLATIIQLDDIFGPTITDSDIDSIVVTEESLPNAEIINSIRKENNLSALSIIMVPFKKGPSQDIIHATHIRKGKLNRAGFSYKSIFRHKILMPDSLKEYLRQPLGILINRNTEFETAQATIEKLKKNSPPMTIAVGDITLISLMKAGFSPDIGIIDGKTKRKKLARPLITTGTPIINIPGSINPSAVDKIQSALHECFSLQKREIILIEGEEDLLALPVILLAPLNSIVMYGLAGKGIVLVVVTEQSKEHILNLLNKFVRST